MLPLSLSNVFLDLFVYVLFFPMQTLTCLAPKKPCWHFIEIPLNLHYKFIERELKSLCYTFYSRTGDVWDFRGGAVAMTLVLLMGSVDQIPGWGTQIMHAVQCGQKLKKKTKNREAFQLA